ncbi:hypothetical protein APHAL10511_007666 [Amanita phalloides]|nr:hypothetical protein APHAL10511_007666 [Amanita phalloides]
MEKQLDPPVGTNYFKSYRYQISGGGATMDVTFYIYVTRVQPMDPNFTSNGGKVIIVVEYQGVDAAPSDEFYFGFAQISATDSVPMSLYILPPSGSETVSGATRTYTIDYSQTMSMFNNGGNSPYNFPARYKRVYTLKGYDQIEDNGRWVLRRDKSASSHDDRLSIGGLQIFEVDRFGNPECLLYFKFSLNGTPYSQRFFLDFRAQTMEDAKL